jgi:hypothetical protein
MAILDDINAGLGRLSERDRKLLGIMVGALSCFLLFVVGVSVNRAISKRAERIATKLGQLHEAAALTTGYREAEKQRTELERKLKEHGVKSLFTYLEDLGKKDELEIGGMTDKGSSPAGKDATIQQASVEVTLTKVELSKLTKFLNDVETSPGVVKVTRLQVRPRDDEPVLDAWFTVTTYYLGA